jgi:regulator of protease activity HflC (stomatin/prohibitin superfamily)
MANGTEPRSLDDRRAQHVAALGFVLQLAAFGTLSGVAWWSQSHVVAAAARFVLIGLPVWFVLFLVFKQLRRVGAEELETTEIRRARAEGAATDAIFEMDDEALLLEQNRLRWMIRWFLPATTILVAAVLLGGHFVMWGWSIKDAFNNAVFKRTQQPTMAMWFPVAVGFMCFLYARYVIALSRIPNWRLLRAGAACMAGNAVVSLGLVIALMASTSVAWAEPLFAYLVRAAMIVLGIELTANFIFDFYRPHTPGVVARPSFDSRLLGLMSEPGGIAKSIADAVNYQFGFEVSSTWFYQLLQRWMFPIMVFTLLVVLALTSIVVVDADEQSVIERFGRPVGKTSTMTAGLHFKWPYPIDVLHRTPVKRVRELVVGEATEKEDEHNAKAILWTEAHDFVPELMLLVAAPKTAGAERRSLDPKLIGARSADKPSEKQLTASVAVNLLMVSMPIEYRVKDLQEFLYNYGEPVKLLEAVAYQILSDYAAGVDIDGLIGARRAELNQKLHQLIQDRLDDLQVGIEIVFAGLRGAHPPAKSQVAEAYHAVVNAETKKAATVEAARGEARKMLTAVAGTESRALALDDAIRARERLQADSASEAHELDELNARVEELLLGNPGKGMAPSTGQAAARVAEARTAASEQVTQASTKVRAFSTEVAAYRAAPELYTQRKVLEVFAGLDPVRKYLIVGDANNVIIEYQTAQEGGLDRVLSEGVEVERKKQGR